MNKLFTGTSGFAYKEWKGSFYPEDLSDSKMLPHAVARRTCPACEALLLCWEAFGRRMHHPQNYPGRGALSHCVQTPLPHA